MTWGGEYGATSTKVVELIMASGLEPPTNIATALFYGVKSDTMNLAREASAADVAAYLYLFPRADNRLLAEIEHPQVPLDYFRVFNKAITRGRIYGTMIVSDLGEVYTPDLCAEVADRLLQVEGVNHALVAGWYEEALFLSLRTRSRAKNAGRILHSLVTKHTRGTAGGHGPMAGARIPMEGRSQRSRADTRRKIVQKVVTAFGQDFKRYSRMVNPRRRRPLHGPAAPQGGGGGEEAEAREERQGGLPAPRQAPRPAQGAPASARGPARVRRVYLDYNATAPVRPEVRRAVEPLLFGEPDAPDAGLARGAGNASSVHWAGQAARKALEGARAELAARYQRHPSEVIFTSGGTEADNLALVGGPDPPGGDPAPPGPVRGGAPRGPGRRRRPGPARGGGGGGPGGWRGGPGPGRAGRRPGHPHHAGQRDGGEQRDRGDPPGGRGGGPGPGRGGLGPRGRGPGRRPPPAGRRPRPHHPLRPQARRAQGRGGRS
jgi:hypothetical protein